MNVYEDKCLREKVNHIIAAQKEGEIIIRAERFRTQERNRQDAEERLVTLIRRAAEPPPPPRKPTRPTRSSVRQRLDTKARRGAVKAGRGKPSAGDW